MRYLLTLLFIFSCRNTVYKETYNYSDCGISIESPYLSDDLTFLPEETLNLAIRIIKVDNDSTSRIDSLLITKAIDSLNAAFKSSNIIFQVLNQEIFVVDDPNIVNYKQHILNFKKEYRNAPAAIDVFVYKANFDYYPGIALSIKSDALAIQLPYFTTNTLIHEIGHCLGLHHTHDNSGNGYNAGDFICDTPETGVISGYIDFNCIPRAKIANLTDEEAEIIINNYMSYVNRSCRREFTKDQIDKMRYHISKESLLRNTLIF